MHGCELQTRGTVCPVEETAGASAWVQDTAWCFFSSAVQRKDKGFWTMGVSGTDVEEGVRIIFKHSGKLLVWHSWGCPGRTAFGFCVGEKRRTRKTHFLKKKKFFF